MKSYRRKLVAPAQITVLLGLERCCPNMFARFEVALKKRAIARVVDKFVQVFNLDMVTHRALYDCSDRGIVALDAFDRTPEEVLPASFLCKSADFIGNLLSQITHLQIGCAVK
jgi:hypothetical protein